MSVAVVTAATLQDASVGGGGRETERSVLVRLAGRGHSTAFGIE